jgi:hypothetical protein
MVSTVVKTVFAEKDRDQAMSAGARWLTAFVTGSAMSLSSSSRA